MNNFLIDISGVPTIPLVFLLKRYPFLHNSFETIVSNLETALILLIVFLLCSGVMISAMILPPSDHNFLKISHFYIPASRFPNFYRHIDYIPLLNQRIFLLVFFLYIYFFYLFFYLLWFFFF